MTEAEQQGLLDGRSVRFLLPRRALRGGAGAQLGPRAGESLEFHDYRDYTPGDDLRNLDWNVLARSDREVIKVRREEIAPIIEVVRDRSASMDAPPAKASAADYLFGLLTSAAPTCRVVERENPKVPHAVRLLLSDLLTDEDPEAKLARLAHQAASLTVVRLLAREEVNPPTGAFEFTDSETGEVREMLLDAATRGHYLEALSAHTSRWVAAARRHGATFGDLVAEDPHTSFIATLARLGIVEGLR